MPINVATDGSLRKPCFEQTNLLPHSEILRIAKVVNLMGCAGISSFSVS